MTLATRPFEERSDRRVRAKRLRMTEAEFVAWVDEDTRAEWVDGDVILMAPVSGEHSLGDVALERDKHLCRRKRTWSHLWHRIYGAV